MVGTRGSGQSTLRVTRHGLCLLEGRDRGCTTTLSTSFFITRVWDGNFGRLIWIGRDTDLLPFTHYTTTVEYTSNLYYSPLEVDDHRDDVMIAPDQSNPSLDEQCLRAYLGSITTITT